MIPSAPVPPATFAAAPRVGDFEAVINLLAVLGEANRQLDTLKSEIESRYLGIVSPLRGQYAKLQATVSETEAALEVIARRNPQWFDDKKSVATPYGAVKFKSSSELVIADENVTIQLIQALGNPTEMLRTVLVPNKEALEKLGNDELARLGILRKAKENFSADTDVIDLGKAVKAADKNDKAAGKAAKKAAALVE